MTVNEAGGKVEAFFVEEHENGMRLDQFLASRVPDYISRSRIKDIIKKSGVTVAGDNIYEPKYRVKLEEKVSLVIPPPEDATPKPERIPLDIQYEDDDLIVINKPAGLVVHPAAGNWTGTLVNALLYHCGDSLSGIGGVKRPGIVHRLDKDTSGLLVVAKSEQAHAHLSAQFADHGRSGPLERAYLALVWGRFDKKTGTVDAPLARSSTNRRKRAVVRDDHKLGKTAITHFTVRKEYGVDKDGLPLVSLVECRLETGRTHQIRVHMSHIGHPLLGDQDYGKHFQTKINALPDRPKKAAEGFQRQALHAAILGFEHPKSGESLKFESNLPEDFSALLASFG